MFYSQSQKTNHGAVAWHRGFRTCGRGRVFAALSASLLIGACAEGLNVGLPDYETERLQPVIVGGVSYPVEKRTRVLSDVELLPGPPVAVWTTVQGKAVYCGTERADCAAAIRRHLEGKKGGGGGDY